MATSSLFSDTAGTVLGEAGLGAVLAKWLPLPAVHRRENLGGDRDGNSGRRPIAKIESDWPAQPREARCRQRRSLRGDFLDQPSASVGRSEHTDVGEFLCG